MLQPEQSLFGYFNTKLADSIIFQSQNIVTFLFSLWCIFLLFSLIWAMVWKYILQQDSTHITEI